MIPTKQKVTIQSNINGIDGEMRLSSKGLGNLMNILSELYTDPIESIIRELSANMLDSHVVAGQTKPPEIITPTQLNATLAFQDYGTGLSLYEILNVFVEYGNSTKTENDEVTGQQGLGSKSPLAYSNSFTVQSVKDNRLVEMIIYKSEGAPKYQIVVDTETDKPNGVRVSVPVKEQDKAKIKNGVIRFAQFLPENTIRVIGTDFVPYKEISFREFIQAGAVGYLKINDNTRLYRSQNTNYYGRADSWVIMGSAAYPISSDYSYKLNLPNKFFYVFDVSPGAVDFAPSREGLKYTELTENYLNQLVENSKDALHDFYDDYMRNNDHGFASSFDKIIFQMGVLNFFPKLPFDEYSFDGKEMKEEYTWARNNLHVVNGAVSFFIEGSGKVLGAEKSHSFNVLRVPIKDPIIVGEREKADSVLFTRAFAYLSAINEPTNRLNYINQDNFDKLPTGFVEHISPQVYSWEDIKSNTRPPAKQKKTTVKTTVYDVSTGKDVPYDANAQYAYMDANTWSSFNSSRFRDFWQMFCTKPVLVLNARQISAPKYANKIHFRDELVNSLSSDIKGQLRTYALWGMGNYRFNECLKTGVFAKVMDILPKDITDVINNLEKITMLYNFIRYNYRMRTELNVPDESSRKSGLLNNLADHITHGNIEVAKQVFLLSYQDSEYMKEK